MKVVAALYFLIMLVNFWLWYTNGVATDTPLTPHLAFTWALYVLSLLALMAFIVGRRILPRTLWQATFVVYVATRLYELSSRGLPLSGENLQTDLNILSSYLWLVLPAGLAMWHLGFVASDLRARASRSSHPNGHKPEVNVTHKRYLQASRSHS